MRRKNSSMLLRIAQADALALGIEFIDREKHGELFEAVGSMNRYVQHPTYELMKPGWYSDDTQQSIAIAELLCITSSPSEVDFVSKFWEVHARDPRDGYSRAMQALLESSKSGDELKLNLQPNSDKNGAAMRSVPIGVIKDPIDVVRYAGLQAATTHATWGGINSSIAVALMSHYALYDRRDFNHMLGWCSRYLDSFDYFSKPWEGPVKARPKVPGDRGIGWNTAWAVHTLLVQEKSLAGIMSRVASWGGDTDSTASIAWGIASARYPDETLPSFLETDLEAGRDRQYGAQFLKDLGEKLMCKYA